MSHEFQLSVNDQMEEVNARILDPPNIKYQYTTVNVSKGSWKMEIFKQPMNLRTDEWSILNLCKDEKLKNMHDFMEKLQRNGKIRKLIKINIIYEINIKLKKCVKVCK